MRSFAPPSPGGDRKGPDVDQPKVGVIVPMYNAAATIDATLESVCAQSYRNLDIVVVDDGGTDASAQIVEARIARDPRIRLVRKLNGGVATARNFGAAATDAPYLAFVDSDDLWAPDKIAAQMAAVAEDPDVPALVYCSYIHIDGDGRAFPALTHQAFEGRVLHDLYRSNFVGNGSSMLMPREIFDHVGGFDPDLRAQKAQGCEDCCFSYGPRKLILFGPFPAILSATVSPWRTCPATRCRCCARSTSSVASSRTRIHRHKQSGTSIAMG